MADPNRDPTLSRSSQSPTNPEPRGPPPGATTPPTHVQTPPKIYEIFHSDSPPSAPPSANALPEGSGQNTAHVPPPTLSDAWKTLHLSDLKQVYQYPCARESLLFGIGSAFGVGGVRALLGARIPKAANWAVGTFILATAGNYEFCLYRRRLERAHMKRAVEIIDRKKGEKEEQARVKREERRRVKEEMDRRAEEEGKNKNKGSWRFW